MSVFKQLSRVWAVELVRGVGVGTGILPDDLFAQVHLDNPVVALVGNENMRGGQPGALHGRAEKVWTGTGLSELTILPDNTASCVHQNDAIIHRPIGSLWDDIGRRARPRHQ